MCPRPWRLRWLRALAVCAIGTLYLGILPGRVLSLARAAADSLTVR